MKHALYIIYFLTFHTFTAQAQKNASTHLAEIIIENIQYDQCQISPNGEWLTFIKYNDSSSNIYFQPLQKNLSTATPITQHKSSYIEEYYWSPNHSSIFFISKEKNTYSLGSILLDFEHPENSLAFQYVNKLIKKPSIYRFSESDPNKIFIGYCPPPSSLENLYSIQLEKGIIQTIISNQQNIQDYFVDSTDQLKFIVSQDIDKQHIISYQNLQAVDTLHTSKPNELIDLIAYQNTTHTLIFSIEHAQEKTLYQLNTTTKKVNSSKKESIVSYAKDVYNAQLTGYTNSPKDLTTKWMNSKFDSIQQKIQLKHQNTSIALVFPNPQLEHLVYSISSTQIPKTYFLYDIFTDSSTFIASTLPTTYAKSKTAEPISNIIFSNNNDLTFNKLSLPIAKRNRVPLVILLETENISSSLTQGYSVKTNYLLDQGYAVLQPFIYTQNNQNIEYTQHINNITDHLYKSIQDAILKGNIDAKNIYIYAEDVGVYLAYQTILKYPTLLKGIVFNDGFIQLETKLNSYPEYWTPEKNRFNEKMGVVNYSPNHSDAIQKLPSTLSYIFLHLENNVGISSHELNQLKKSSSHHSEVYQTPGQLIASSNERIDYLGFIKGVAFFHQLGKKSYHLPKELENKFNHIFLPYQYTSTDSIIQFKEEKFPPLRGKLRKNEFTYNVTLKWNGEIQQFQQTRNIKLEQDRYLINSYQMDHMGVRTEKMYLSVENMPVYQEIIKDEFKKSFTFTKEKTYVVTNDVNKEIVTPKSYLVVGNTFDIVVGNLPLKVGYVFNTYVIDEYSQEFQPYRLEVIGEASDVYKDMFVIELRHIYDKNSFIKIWIDKRTRLMTRSIQQIPSQGNLIIEKQLVQ